MARIATFLLLFSASLFCHAYTPKQTSTQSPALQKKLISLQHEIKNLENQLVQDKASEKDLIYLLSEIEIEMGYTHERIRQYQTKILNLTQEREGLIEKYQILKSQQEQQVELLASLLQQIHRNSQRERWSIILSQSDLYELIRMNHYYQATSNARKNEIQQLIQKLLILKKTENALLKNENHLIQMQTKAEENKQTLAKTQGQRKSLLANIQKRMNNQSQSLSLLKQEQRSLESVIGNLKQNLNNIPEYIEPTLNFSRQKDKLMFPIQLPNATLAKVMNHPKATQKKTYVKAPQGTPIYAIYSGRVVFSEWLRGIGLLLIIDHGNGYMSLYGNNEILYKAAGDWVQKGDVVARVGHSGGHSEPGLYFELRKDGIALDPSEWFKLT